MTKRLVDSYLFRHQKGLGLPLEAILALLAEGPLTVMGVLHFFEKKKIFSSATIHRYLMEGAERKWIKFAAGKDKRQKMVSITYEGKGLLAKVGSYYQ